MLHTHLLAGLSVERSFVFSFTDENVGIEHRTMHCVVLRDAACTVWRWEFTFSFVVMIGFFDELRWDGRFGYLEARTDETSKRREEEGVKGEY